MWDVRTQSFVSLIIMNQSTISGRTFRFLSWNVRGANDPNKRFKIRSFLLDTKPDLVSFQETKLSPQTPQQLSQITGNVLTECVQLPANGAAGGIVLAWNPRKFTRLSVVSMEHCISATYHFNFDKTVFKITTVYGPPHQASRQTFFSELQSQQLSSDTPWMLLGDFNQTIDVADRSNTRRGPDLPFVSLVHALDLIDLPLIGRRYTWSRGTHNPTFVHLDRVLISNEWSSKFPNTAQQALHSTISDHCPLQCTVNTSFPLPNTFRFENYWLKMHDFTTLVVSNWQARPTATNPTQLSLKLHNLRKAIREWKDTKAGTINSQQSHCKQALFWLTTASETRLRGKRPDSGNW